MKIFLLFMGIFCNLLAANAQTKCNTCDSVIHLSRLSAAEAALISSFRSGDLSTQSALAVPYKKVEEAVHLMCRITDTLYSKNPTLLYYFKNKIYTKQLGRYHLVGNEYLVYADTSYAPLKQFIKNGSFGNTVLDSLLKKVGAKISKTQKVFGKTYVELKTDSFVHDSLWLGQIKKVDVKLNFSNIEMRTDGSWWYYEYQSPHYIVYLNEGKGDCFSGCIHRNLWKWVLHEDSCGVQEVIALNDKIKNQGENINSGYIPDQYICGVYQSQQVQYDIAPYLPSSGYLNGAYGHWKINGKMYSHLPKLTDTGTYFISFVPYDSLWKIKYRDTFNISFKGPDRMPLLKQDSFILCNTVNTALKELILPSALKYAADHRFEFNPDSNTRLKTNTDTLYRPFIVNLKKTFPYACDYYDTLYYRMAYYFPNKSQFDTLDCTRTSLVLRPRLIANTYAWNPTQSSNIDSLKINQSGIYTVKYTYNGCGIEEIFRISKREQNMHGLANTYTLFSNDTLKIAPQFTWKKVVWNDTLEQDTLVIYSSNTSDTLDYKMYVKDFWGCEQTHYFKVFRMAKMGLDEDKIHAIQVFPNPADQWLYFYTSGSQAPYTILDATGKEITRGMISKNLISLKDLSNGVYFLRVYLLDKNTTIHQTFIISR